MRIYLNVPAKLHRDPIWTVGALSWGCLNENKNNNNQMNSDMKSVPDLQTLNRLWTYLVLRETRPLRGTGNEYNVTALPAMEYGVKA